ncbi:uncharacterized protein CBL_06625 [Carabus blaptoides fortunei]
MATSSFSRVDEYGFERSSSFNIQVYDEFMSHYLKVLARRNKKWSDLVKSSQKLKKNSKLKRYVRKGIPSEHRRQFWMFISGAQALRNDNPELYTKLRQLSPKQSIVDTIKTDIPRTFPDNIFFNNSIELPEQLYNVLLAYAHHNTEVGYCQGLNYIVGLLLLATKSEETAFWLLKVLIEQILPKYYISTMSGLITDIEVLSQLVHTRDPEVDNHIQKLGVPWAVITTKWFVCLFAEVLPTETVLRLWDCLFYEGSKVLFRVALTMIQTNRTEILKCKDLAALITCFKGMVKDTYVVKCHDFMQDIFKKPGSLSNSLISNLRSQHGSKNS